MVPSRAITTKPFAAGVSFWMLPTLKSRPLQPRVLVILAAALVCLGVGAFRRSILRAAGWALVVDERPEHAEAIVIAVATHEAGVLEAAELVQKGIAPRVAVFADPLNPSVQREFVRGGIPYEDAATRSVRQLKQLAIANVEQIPGYVSRTENEGPALAAWCDQKQYGRVIVVTTPDHSRRLRRVLLRSMKGHPAKAFVCLTHYSDFDPDRWWESHSGTRTELEELEKLLLDVVRHPLAPWLASCLTHYESSLGLSGSDQLPIRQQLQAQNIRSPEHGF